MDLSGDGWSPGRLVPGMPGMPEGLGPNPQSYDTDLFTKVRMGPSGMPRSASGRSDRPESGSEGSGYSA